MLDTNQFNEEFELGNGTDFFVRYPDILIDAFDFPDFKKFHSAFTFLKNPFVCNQLDIQHLLNLFNAKNRSLPNRQRKGWTALNYSLVNEAALR